MKSHSVDLGIIQGREITVALKSERISQLYTLRALVGGREVGHLVAMIQSDTEVLLSEVMVEKEVASTNVSTSGLFWWLHPKSGTESFRGRRIGTTMLEHFLGWCREMKFHESFGSIVQQDLDESPWLLEWYRRHGFEVCPPDDRCLRNAVCMVVWRPLS